MERKKRPTLEMSAWERRKQYWQNLCTPGKTTESTIQGESIPSTSTIRPIRTVQPRPASKPPAAKHPRLSPTCTKSAPKRPAAKAVVSAAPTKAVVPRKRGLSVTDTVPIKKIKTTAESVSRRATINTTDTARPMRNIKHRLTDIKAVASNLVAKPTPTTDFATIKKRRTYHHIPSRIETGLKKQPTRSSITCNPKKNTNFKRPHTPFGPAATVGSKTKDKRGSFTIVKNPDDIGNIPDDLNMASTSSVAMPLSGRRGSYTISTDGAISVDQLEDKMYDPITDITNENDFVAGNLGNTPRPIRQGSYTISSEDKGKEEKPKEDSSKKPPIVIKVPRRNVRSSTMSVSDIANKGRVTRNNKSQAKAKNLQKVGKSRSNLVAIGGISTSKVSTTQKNDVPPIRRALSTRTSKPNHDKSTVTGTIDKNVANIALKAVDLSKATGVKQADKLTDAKKLPAVKTPKSAMKSGASRVVKSLNFASDLNDANVFDAENVPPVEAGYVTPVQSVNARPKRSKSVSFQVGLNGSNSGVTLPKTPRREPSLRQKLENFMEGKGYSVSRHRHLHCFGFELSELKKGRPSTSRARRSTVEPTSPSLKARQIPSTVVLPTTPASAQNSQAQEKTAAILNDLKELLLLGQPVEEGEEWMTELENKMLANLEEQSVYWVVKALLAEQAGKYHQALAIFTQAVERNTQPADDLLSALNDFMARISSAKLKTSAVETETVEEPPVADLPKKSKKKKGKKVKAEQLSQSEKKVRAKRDFKEMFESTVIKYTVQDSSTLHNLNKILNISSPKVLAVVTPVRRSTRLSRSAKKRTSFNLDELPKPLRERVIHEPNTYL